jgi:hypothetical protein
MVEETSIGAALVLAEDAVGTVITCPEEAVVSAATKAAKAYVDAVAAVAKVMLSRVRYTGLAPEEYVRGVQAVSDMTDIVQCVSDFPSAEFAVLFQRVVDYSVSDVSVAISCSGEGRDCEDECFPPWPDAARDEEEDDSPERVFQKLFCSTAAVFNVLRLSVRCGSHGGTQDDTRAAARDAVKAIHDVIDCFWCEDVKTR